MFKCTDFPLAAAKLINIHELYVNHEYSLAICIEHLRVKVHIIMYLCSHFLHYAKSDEDGHEAGGI